MLSKWANLIVFILNLLAMMHLGKAAGACMEELVPKLGMRIVSIFDAMTSSSVELAVAAFALMKGLVRVVQAAMLGAILNNLLMMMGIALCVGGYYHREQKIQADTSQTGMNLLMIVCISYVIPVALDTQLIEATRAITEGVQHDLWTISKVMAIVMLILYGCCLLFQYDSTSFMVTPEAKHTGAHTVHRRNVHYWFAGLGYSVMLGAQIYSANLLVHAVEALGKQFHLNDSFVGFVLLPIVLIADLQEEVIAIKESRANRLDRSIALMVGSCMQIALLVTPLLVLLGWVVDVPMTFRFSLLEAAVLAGSVLIVNYLLQDNETNWLEGCLLLAAFFMCALAFYYDIKPFESELGSGDHEPGAGSHH
ncbi:Sodium/calcium exchanger protein-domain-containing protein [Lobosporangium transversale]|uniref:Vacuolar calcium ion transporter n=1 Tax=Lobosporangium transversale TaxID=64571 RepID=A0A1Y2GG62_9FUNG|nr:Sodium/calcium exchanger protein-domain-containing protein [Lobosporangium transversale]ORZ08839.1 Sodium/calcium exchanger protein-domain-containing protein [Lobosporangium transversale]|eukprot:XP_021878622.1 Sodium/calcium exchanger protein-domain-containing protein [Lobosporangium transversale]